MKKACHIWGALCAMVDITPGYAAWLISKIKLARRLATEGHFKEALFHNPFGGSIVYGYSNRLMSRELINPEMVMPTPSPIGGWWVDPPGDFTWLWGELESGCDLIVVDTHCVCWRSRVNGQRDEVTTHPLLEAEICQCLQGLGLPPHLK